MRRIVVNQVIPYKEAASLVANEAQIGDSIGAVTAGAADVYLGKVRKGQATSITELRNTCAISKIPLLEIPYFDMEVRTVYGLRVLKPSIFPSMK